MALVDDLKSEVTAIFKTKWQQRDGAVVPEPEAVALGNDAVKLNGTVLYADLADSTEMVKTYRPAFAAEVYKAYLNCSCRIIRSNDGVITAFDGDRVMAVFLGPQKNTAATKTALQINHAVTQIINTQIPVCYPPPDPNSKFLLRQAVGIDTSELFVARTGIRGSNDLVWVGRAANFAAKLCALRQDDYASWITAEVFKDLPENLKTANGTPMWEARTWTPQGITVYRSKYRWNM